MVKKMKDFIMKRKVAVIIVAIDIIILLIVYFAIQHFEKTNPENMSGAHTSSEMVLKSDQKDNGQDSNQIVNQTESNTRDNTDNSVNSNDQQDGQQSGIPEYIDSQDGRPEIIYRKTTVNEKKNITTSDNGVSYNLHVVDAAGPARYYELLVSYDGGATNRVLNSDPFSGKGGSGNGVYFLNDQVGFVSLLDSNGEAGTLYCTRNGGATFSPVDLSNIIVAQMIITGENYEPFDAPEVPYMEDGVLKLVVDQGCDGDYNGGSSAILESYDEGQTWNYIREVIIQDYIG